MKSLLPILKMGRVSAVFSSIRICSQTWLVAGCTLFCLLIAGNTTAQDSVGISIHAPTADRDEVQRVCKAAQHASALLRKCGIESSKDINISIQEKLLHPSTVDVFGRMGFPAIGQKQMPRQFFMAFFSDHYFPSKHRTIGIGLPVPEIHPTISCGELILKTACSTGC